MQEVQQSSVSVSVREDSPTSAGRTRNSPNPSSESERKCLSPSNQRVSAPSATSSQEDSESFSSVAGQASASPPLSPTEVKIESGDDAVFKVPDIPPSVARAATKSRKPSGSVGGARRSSSRGLQSAKVKRKAEPRPSGEKRYTVDSPAFKEFMVQFKGMLETMICPRPAKRRRPPPPQKFIVGTTGVFSDDSDSSDDDEDYPDPRQDLILYNDPDSEARVDAMEKAFYEAMAKKDSMLASGALRQAEIIERAIV